MSENSEPLPKDDKKEDLQKLADELRAKYGIRSGPVEIEVKEVSNTSEEEVKNKEFFDVKKFTASRSRFIENKYGLKPMEEIIAPKTDEQKKKDLEEYMRKQHQIAMQRPANQINKTEAQIEMESIRRENGPYPVQYKYFEDYPGYKPEVNIGEKWANMLETQVIKDSNLTTSLRRGGYTYEAWKKGRVGVDKYFILFGLLGAFIIPFYIYRRHSKFKEFLRQERGLKPGEEIDLENGKWDLDELSYHKSWYEDKKEKMQTYEDLVRKAEIRKVEEKIYGKSAFGSSA